jgi:hypothetical protein
MRGTGTCFHLTEESRYGVVDPENVDDLEQPPRLARQGGFATSLYVLSTLLARRGDVQDASSVIAH